MVSASMVVASMVGPLVLHLLLDQLFVVQVSAADTRASGVAVDDVGGPYVR